MAEGVVGLFRKKTLNDLIPIHPDNIGNKDWVILLEAGTIVGPSPQRIRVARCIQEKNILKKSDMPLRTKRFMVIEGYNPRIHAVYLCPQLFRYDSDKLVPLEGDEIGELIARSIEAGSVERCPWYDPMERLPKEPLFGAMQMRPRRDSVPVGGQPLVGRPGESAEASAPLYPSTTIIRTTLNLTEE
jgi:hypothetical protein